MRECLSVLYAMLSICISLAMSLSLSVVCVGERGIKLDEDLYVLIYS